MCAEMGDEGAEVLALMKKKKFPGRFGKGKGKGMGKGKKGRPDTPPRYTQYL